MMLTSLPHPLGLLHEIVWATVELLQKCQIYILSGNKHLLAQFALHILFIHILLLSIAVVEDTAGTFEAALSCACVIRGNTRMRVTLRVVNKKRRLPFQ